MTEEKNLPRYSALSLTPKLGLFVCAGKKQLRALEKHYKLDLEPDSHYYAFVSSAENDKGNIFYIMYLPKGKKITSPYFLAAIAHEAYHVASRYLRDIGETYPGEEHTAYIIQEVTQCALTVYKADQGK